jgi:hypothetical protein
MYTKYRYIFTRRSEMKRAYRQFHSPVRGFPVLCRRAVKTGEIPPGISGAGFMDLLSWLDSYRDLNDKKMDQKCPPSPSA